MNNLVKQPETYESATTTTFDGAIDVVTKSEQHFAQNYDVLLERNFQLLPRRDRERILGLKQGDQAESTDSEVASKQIDKTLKSNFQNFDEQHQIGLVGVFFEDDTYAVLQKVNFETKESTYRKLALLDHIGPYQLVELTAKRARFRSPDRTLTLNLYTVSEHANE